MDSLTHTGFDPALVRVSVATTYLPSHSRPDNMQFTFAYTITISNSGDSPVQLLERHWLITDAEEQVQEVRGEGVVGEQPVIAPGGQFRYTSGTTLETAVGFMEGSYTMTTLESPLSSGAQAEIFEVFIPPFTLHTPNALH